jgi:hypothetical protein
MGRNSRRRHTPSRLRQARATHAPGPATQTLEASVLGLVTVQTAEGLMVDPTALERLLRALYPILRALPPDGPDLTDADRHWLAQVARIGDAVAELDVHFTARMTSATFTRVDDDQADVDQVDQDAGDIVDVDVDLAAAVDELLAP